MRAPVCVKAATAFALAAMSGTGVASAMQLQRLHVTSFTLTSDVPRAIIEQPFHLIVTIHVSENVAELQNIDLPDFFGVEELADERHTIAGPNGTDYREVLTLVAHQSGTIHFTPATLAAIDARDGKPKRFLSNALMLQVAGGVANLRNAFAVAGILALRVILGIVALAIAAALAVALFLRLRRRPQIAAPPVPAPVPAPPAPRPARAIVHEALDGLRLARSRAQVLVLRRELWSAIGAREGETLTDALRHPAAREPRTRAVLRAAERAAFVSEAFLQTAIDDLIDTTERYLT